MAGEDIRIRLVVDTTQANRSIRDTEKNIEGLAKGLKGADNTDFPSLRYALYDVANATGAVTQGIQDFLGAVTRASMEYETAFTDIERTTVGSGANLAELRTQFEGLASTIPIAFQDLTQIGSLGAQLGIAANDLTSFTETVAKFSATTNVTTERAAQAFGALGELLNVSASEYENLGSSISKVGVNSVATETQILSVAEAIGGVAGNAGLTAEYTIGLAGALASLKIPAEQSRGALTRMFQEIQRSAAGTGVDMQIFADVLGVTKEEAIGLANNNMQQFFDTFIAGLSRIDPSQLTSALDAMNLSDIRVYNVSARLARNTDLIASTMEDSTSAFAEGTFLTETYGFRVEDLAAKLQILQNNLATLAATVGDAVAPVLKPLIDLTAAAVKGITDILDTDAGKWAAGTVLALAGIVGLFASIVTASATVAASIMALNFAFVKLGWAGATTGLKGFIATTVSATISTRALGASVIGTTGAVAGLSRGMAFASLAMRALPVVGLIALLAELAVAATQAGQNVDAAFDKYVGTTAGLGEALAADMQARDAARAAGNNELANSYILVRQESLASSSAQDELAEKFYNTATILGSNLKPNVDGATDALRYNTLAIGENTLAWFRNQLQQNEAFQNLVGSDAFVDEWQSLGVDIDKAIEAAAANGQQGVKDYFMSLAIEAARSGSLAAEVVRRQKADIEAGLSTPLKTLRRQVAFDAVSTRQMQEIQQLFGATGNRLRIMGGEAQRAAEGIKGTGESASGAAPAIKNYGSSAGGAAQKVRTLVDYSNDLSQIFERARDIRFSGTETLDKITSSFQKIAKESAEAAESINELNADISGLTADRALQEYFLSVAEAYGDTLKAQEIRANLAKIDGDLVKKNKELEKAQNKTNKTLVGNSEAAIENRGEILDLVKGYQDHIKALAASGMKQDELREKTTRLKADFIAQATQLGYNADELGLYAVAFDDVTAAINNVPRDVTVDFNGDPALTAIQEFAAKSRAAIAGAGGSVNVNTSGLEGAGEDAGYKFKKGFQRGANGALLYYDGSGRFQGSPGSIKFMASGGLVTGPGTSTSDSVPAQLSAGEYVVRSAAVDRYGVGFFDRLNQMRTPNYFSGPSPRASGVSVVALSPEDRALLRNVGGSGEVVLYADNQAIARSANAGNKAIVAAGGRP